ncbi:hypothetical protein N9C66_05560 [Akkermansiaceae bacterium]|jgi:hypothetical protein|nr:hypothetical protein [Akkermansiaceae bacterium]MDA9830789.1 hypothetical protein [Akkermansiaceae bacterium]MDB4809497.1 hypothetical protein [bacterium]MDF1711801.1 hypothetical protein [Akkermansiaceae bacterium]
MSEKFNQNPENSCEGSESKPQFDSFGEAFKAGTTDGAAKAREKVPGFKTGVADAVHDIAYGLAYGSVFAAAFINELIPANIRDGLSRGAEDGKAAGKKACDTVQDALGPDDKSIEGSDITNPSFS